MSTTFMSADKLLLTSESVTVIVWRWKRRPRLTRSAPPRNAISRPANGRIGQKPRLAMKPAIPKETKHRLPKKSNAARTLSEQ